MEKKVTGKRVAMGGGNGTDRTDRTHGTKDGGRKPEEWKPEGGGPLGPEEVRAYRLALVLGYVEAWGAASVAARIGKRVKEVCRGGSVEKVIVLDCETVRQAAMGAMDATRTLLGMLRENPEELDAGFARAQIEMAGSRWGGGIGSACWGVGEAAGLTHFSHMPGETASELCGNASCEDRMTGNIEEVTCPECRRIYLKGGAE